MKLFVKNSLALTLAGILIVAAASPSAARSWRYGAAAGAGLVAGTAVGAAAANAAMYSGYNYGPAYQAYAYSPGGAYGAYGAYGYGGYPDGSDGYSGCAAAGNYGGKTDFGAC